MRIFFNRPECFKNSNGLSNKIPRLCIFLLIFFALAGRIFAFKADDFTRIFGLKLGISTIFDAKKELGKAAILEIQDGTSYEDKLSYILGNETEKIEFGSGKLGGRKRILLTYAVSLGNEIDRKKLQRLKFDIEHIDVQGLHLGLTRNEVEALLADYKLKGDYVCTAHQTAENELMFWYSKKVKKKIKRKRVSIDITITIDTFFDESEQLSSYRVTEIVGG